MESRLMHGKITGIDISEDHITAVQVRGELKGYQILACVRVPVEDGGLDEALKSLSGSLESKSDTCLVSIPEGHVSFRNVEMPFKDMKKIRQTLPFEMESMLPFPVEDLLIDFILTGGPGRGGVLAASVKREFISEYLWTLHANGIDPEVLEIRSSPLASWLLKKAETPDHILILDMGERRNTLILCSSRRVVLIRAFGSVHPHLIQSGSADNKAGDLKTLSPEENETCFRTLCATIHHTVHAFISRSEAVERPEKLFFTGPGALYPEAAGLLSRFLDMPAEPIDVANDKKVRMNRAIAGDWSPHLMNGALCLTLKNIRKEEGFNLRREEFEPERRYLRLKKEIPRIAVFLFLILSFLAADMVIDYYSLKKEYRTLDQESTTIFRQTLPKVTKIVDPVQQLRVTIGGLKKSTVSRPAGNPNNKVLNLLQEISRRIPKSVNVQINRMVIDPETVRISGKTDAFNEVDKIKNDLEPSTVFGAVNISSANLDRTGKRVQFEINIERKR